MRNIFKNQKATSHEAAVMLRANPPVVMTKQEAAVVCGVSKRTLSDWISKYGLKVFKLGSTVRIMRDDLFAFYKSYCGVELNLSPIPNKGV